MKKIFYTLSCLWILQTSIAQVNTNLIVSATPPSSLLQWSINRETLIFLVQAQAGAQRQFKIKTEIKLSDGTVVGKTDLARSTIYTLGSANTVFNATDVVPMEYMMFNGKYKTALEKTGKLPSDNYEICVQLVTPTDFAPFSEIKCKNFYLAAAQLPILMKPANEEVLNYDIAKTTIIFRWTPVVPRPKALVTYKILVFEVLKNQNPVQAMRSNFPILSRDIIGTTQYIWQPQGILDDNSTDTDSAAIRGNNTVRTDRPNNPNPKKKNATANEENNAADKQSQGVDFGQKKAYVWTVQSIDNTGQPIGDGSINADGVSEPVMFFIKRKRNPGKPKYND